MINKELMLKHHNFYQIDEWFDYVSFKSNLFISNINISLYDDFEKLFLFEDWLLYRKSTFYFILVFDKCQVYIRLIKVIAVSHSSNLSVKYLFNKYPVGDFLNMICKEYILMKNWKIFFIFGKFKHQTVQDSNLTILHDYIWWIQKLKYIIKNNKK